jgi:serine/threonine-protein kinase
MIIHSVDNLIEALQESQLLTAAQMDELVMNLQSGFAEPADLAEDLVHRRWLTVYQAKQLFRGHGRELTLGQYVLLDQLGAGGTARVFKARHRRLERIDALKVVRPEQVAHPRALQLFQQEARAAARLSHPNIVTIYDADEAGGRHYLAMEYVDGDDLVGLVRDNGPLPAALACDYIWQAALGLQHASEREVVHRDIKPSNLLLTADRVMVKILDMGLALFRQSSAGTCGSVPNGVVMGTPDYMAPEQAVASHQVDIRADIYSLGCTLYFLLTGQPPFPGGSAKEKLVRHHQAEPAPLECRRPNLPLGLGSVVRRMTAKRPDDRYATPEEAAADLRPFCSDKELAAALRTVRGA